MHRRATIAIAACLWVAALECGCGRSRPLSSWYWAPNGWWNVTSGSVSQVSLTPLLDGYRGLETLSRSVVITNEAVVSALFSEMRGAAETRSFLGPFEHWVHARRLKLTFLTAECREYAFECEFHADNPVVRYSGIDEDDNRGRDFGGDKASHVLFTILTKTLQDQDVRSSVMWCTSYDKEWRGAAEGM